MKKRRALLTLLALLLVVGIPTLLMLREYRQERLNRDLIAAIQVEDTGEALAALKAGADPNSREASIRVPPSIAEHCQQLIGKILHRSVGWNPIGGREPSDAGRTALMFYLGTNTEYDVNFVKALLDAGADPNATLDETGLSPLIWTVIRNDYRTTRLLLERGANINHRDCEGETPLDWSVENGENKISPMLRQAGAKTGKELDAEAKH
ncbi:MAG TPA: ankyrin repeat domain-containing protein [Chthonomonadaceae bacterium]|nr:ankyrin repeat domain-containing protein [Chthonomonadaceae bacterium]